MRFQVPQFIEMEDKIVGPLSFKEFIYLAAGAGLAYIIYRFTPSIFIALPLMAPVIGFALALAFYRPNSKPFIEMVQSAIIFFIGHKLYIWKKEEKPLPVREIDTSFQKGITNVQVPTLSRSKLADLNWNIGVNSNTPEEKSVNETLNIKI